ncbi:MAG: UDP-N-acetylmuramoyl-tripeptide--D-alanyl-D-alanine ligase [Candidatus Omnitrophica bacterium]|nr:UDP-N-acetylmuramoyl-tripeptide--D-alanyl-D-alanine ligase [Candidatus Omnitrophota bacterium]
MLTIREIIKAVNGQVISEVKTGLVAGVSTDSRTVQPGELFIAIKGEKFDGHAFVNEVAQKGVSVMLVSEDVVCPRKIVVIKVKDTTQALGDLARYYRSKFDIPVIAVTGSVGKTTTKDMIAEVLSTRYQALKSAKSFNNQFGVPLTILKLRKEYRVLILELGTNHKGEIAGLARIAAPTICVFTAIGESHLEGLGSELGVFREKSQMVKFMRSNGVVVYNADNKFLRKLASDKYHFSRVSYSVAQKSDYQAEHIQQQENISFTVQNKKFILNDPVIHNVYNALAALVCGKLLKVPDDAIQNGLKKFKNPDGRQNFYAINKSMVIDDTYNANPVSYRSAVATLGQWPAGLKKIMVCGDMLELGEGSAEQHRSVGEAINETDIDAVVTLGEGAAFIGQAVKKLNSKKVYICQTLQQIEARLKLLCAKSNAVVLVKGSRGMKMERVVDFLKQYFKTL